MSKLEIDEVVVKRHFKIRNRKAVIAFDSREAGIGVWFQKEDEPDSNQFGIYFGHGSNSLNAVFYPPKSFFNGGVKQRMPFSLGENGLQFPLPNGQVKIIPLDALVTLLDHLSVGIGELIPRNNPSAPASDSGDS